MADVLLLSAKKRTSSAEVLEDAKDVFITRDVFAKKFLYHFCGTIEPKNEAEKASTFGRGGGEADGEGKTSPLTRYRGSSPRGRALRDAQLYGCGFFDMLYCEKVTFWQRHLRCGLELAFCSAKTFILTPRFSYTVEMLLFGRGFRVAVPKSLR